METAKRIYRPDELQPSEPIHPGEILKDELNARGISQRKFAAVIGVSYSVLNEVINGKRPINTEYALKIEAATGIPASAGILSAKPPQQKGLNLLLASNILLKSSAFDLMRFVSLPTVIVLSGSHRIAKTSETHKNWAEKAAQF